MKKLLIFSILVLISGFYLNDAFADINFNQLEISSNDIWLIERDDFNIIIAEIEITNTSDLELSYYEQSNWYIVSSGKNFERSTYTDLGVGNETCPSLDDVSPGVTKKQILCFEVPKNLPNSSLILELVSNSKDFCQEYTFSECTSTSNSISNPKKIDYQDHLKKFIKKITNISIDFESIQLIESDESNILKINFSVKNISSEKINYYSSSVYSISPNGFSYSPVSRYDLPDSSYNDDECRNDSISMNPGLVKSYSYCFEVPKGINTFDLVIRDDYVFEKCDSTWYDCNELLLSISNPKQISLNDSQENLNQSGTPEPEPESETESEPQPLGIASFVDQTKDPQYYIDRYNNEPKYKEWFDTNYPQYSSIYEAVGLKEIKSEKIDPEPTSISAKKVPDWAKNIFGWYANDIVSEDELLNAIRYLIKEGIIKVD